MSEFAIPSSRRLLPTHGLFGASMAPAITCPFEMASVMIAFPILPAAPATQNLSIKKPFQILLVVESFF